MQVPYLFTSLYISDETPLVNFAVGSESQFGTVVAGTSRTYKATDLCFLNGVFIDPGYIHDVLLTGLKPSTTYHYSCGVEGVSCPSYNVIYIVKIFVYKSEIVCTLYI